MAGATSTMDDDALSFVSAVSHEDEEGVENVVSEVHVTTTKELNKVTSKANRMAELTKSIPDLVSGVSNDAETREKLSASVHSVNKAQLDLNAVENKIWKRGRDDHDEKVLKDLLEKARGCLRKIQTALLASIQASLQHFKALVRATLSEFPRAAQVPVSEDHARRFRFQRYQMKINKCFVEGLLRDICKRDGQLDKEIFVREWQQKLTTFTDQIKLARIAVKHNKMFLQEARQMNEEASQGPTKRKRV